MYAIETKNLTKKYDSQLALNQLNLKVKTGEVYGFIGKNGAGKTTTINLLLSLLHQTEGSILIQGEEISFQDQEYKKTIGFVPDVPAYPKYMNAEEYLTYCCDMFEMEKDTIPSKVKEVLEFVDLSNIKKRIAAYSRGMKQRLAIAQALVHDPDILIMDEPTSALDPIGRKDVMNIILKLKGNKTIFYSTHILDDVEKVCDRIGLLDNGVLILEDSIKNIQDNFIQNKMYIETDMKPKEFTTYLIDQGVKNEITENHKGIICNIQDETSANDILELLVKNKVQVYEYRKLTASLEEVFMKATNEETT